MHGFYVMVPRTPDTQPGSWQAWALAVGEAC